MARASNQPRHAAPSGQPPAAPDPASASTCSAAPPTGVTTSSPESAATGNSFTPGAATASAATAGNATAGVGTGRPAPGTATANATVSTPPPERKVRLGSLTSLLAIVPHLLGFRPENSLVVLGTEPPRGRIKVTLRYDLPDPPDEEVIAEVSAHAIGVLASQRIESAVVIGYGPERLVTPLVKVIMGDAPTAGLLITELLRVDDSRYWSYLCANTDCCPAEGREFETSGQPVAAAMAAAGSQVLGTRSDLAATVAPLTGPEGEAMRVATRRAEARAARLLARVERSGKAAAARRLIATDGLRAVFETITRYRAGERPRNDDEFAWLTIVLRDLRVRDDAWARMDPEHREAHLRMWTDIVRRARPGYVAAPAALLAFVAWQCGNGALANVALDRALDDDRGYSMAQLLRQVIDSGAPPSVARLPMTPEEVAASYDDQETDDQETGDREADEREPSGSDDENGERSQPGPPEPGS